MESGPSLEALTDGLYVFLIDIEEYGRTYPAKINTKENIVTYKAMGYNVRVRFDNKYHCNVDAKKGPLEMEELMSIPYENNEPDWETFFRGVLILAEERLTNREQ